MTPVDHEAILTASARVIGNHDWDALGSCYHEDAVIEYPQSGERFIGLQNIRAQFENYPGGLELGGTRLDEVIGGTTYALSPMYTVIAVEGSGNRGTAILRVRYPDQSLWWAINLYELREDKIARSRVFFAPAFDPPEWRAPFRDQP